MADPHKKRDPDSFLFDLMKFLFIFFLILIMVVAIYASGILNTETPPHKTTENTPLQTLPPTTESTRITTTATSATETTPTSSETTSQSTRYPPATVPTTESTSTATTATEPPRFEMVSDEEIAELVTEKFLTVHENSRPGYKLTELKNIVVHYIGNAGTTADQNWRNFENNKPQTSSHFIIDLDGSILQLMPLDEVAWAIGTTEGNYTSISIECCHPDATGKFTDETYTSLVKLVSWLCNKFGLDRDDVLRHYDYERVSSSGYIWHKSCPLYWANDKDPESHKRWEAFKNDLIFEE